MQRATAVVCGLLAAAASVNAEQRLSDIAGSIELQRPAGEQLVMVEPGPERTGMGVPTSGDALIEIADQLLATGRAAADLLEETRTSLAFFDDGWRRRMSSALEDIDAARVEVEFSKPPDRYRDAVALTLEGARQYQIAAGIVRWAMLRDQALFSGAFDYLESGDRKVATALVQLRYDARDARWESGSAPPDELTPGQTVSQFCASRHRMGDSGAYDRCVADQRASLEAMRGRFSFTVGLDEASFNSIRNRCRDEWPEDLAARDLCERERMSAASR